jgi:hypothetical protein
MSKTQAQKARQDARNQRGQYKKNPCQGCGKAAPIEDYYSHPLTDTMDATGENWADIALVLCGKCSAATQKLETVAEFRNYQRLRYGRRTKA